MKSNSATLAVALVLFVPTSLRIPAQSDDNPQATQSTNAQQQTKVNAGGKDDIDAIGNRDIGGGRGIGNWYSLEGEIRMGREYAQMIDSSVKLVQDPSSLNMSTGLDRTSFGTLIRRCLSPSSYRLRRSQRVCAARRILLCEYRLAPGY
jgi:hypothetical protein